MKPYFLSICVLLTLLIGCLCQSLGEDRPAELPSVAQTPGGADPSSAIAVGTGVEPIQRLEGIERALDTLEEDFQPAAPVGPEVELVFDQRNPFAERFEEEEKVVVDRYHAAGDASVSASTWEPIVGAEGGLREFQHSFVAGNICSAPGITVQVAAATSAADCAPPPAPVNSVPAAGESSPPTLPLRRETCDAEADDSDLIVVEDDYDDLNAPHVRPLNSVRKQEYRQLFARLRRG